MQEATGFVQQQTLDWTKPVMRILDFAALISFMSQHSLTRKALEISRSAILRYYRTRVEIVAPGASIVTEGVGSITLCRLYFHKAITHVVYETKIFPFLPPPVAATANLRASGPMGVTWIPRL